MTVNEVLNILESVLPTNMEFCTMDFDRVEDAFADYRDISTDAGATKGVLILDDYVIKIPFTGEWYDGGYGDDTSHFCEFFSAPGSIDYDYCHAEVFFYEHAEKNGVNQYFLKTEWIDEIYGIGIYRQPRAVMFENDVDHKHSDEERKNTENFCSSSGVRCFNRNWITDFINCYGEKAFLELSAFLEDYVIEDLHSGNLGYYNGKPVIVDYGGYYE